MVDKGESGASPPNALPLDGTDAVELSWYDVGQGVLSVCASTLKPGWQQSTRVPVVHQRLCHLPQLASLWTTNNDALPYLLLSSS